MRYQHGVFAILSAPLLLLILMVCAMALGLSQMYNRKIELQSMANAVALAAAIELDGTDLGVDTAKQKAAQTAGRFVYNYSEAIVWSDDAISFSSSPSAGWIAPGAGGAAKLFYVKVDTAKLARAVGIVTPIFAVFIPGMETLHNSATAIAGRTGIKVTPLAVCALDTAAATNRSSELVEFGFRRGIPYDLMKLNPGGTVAENFVVDPVVPPGTSAPGYNTAFDTVSPFVCTGKMWMPRVTGGVIQVTRPFPVDKLFKQLNSRFDQYVDKLCSPNGAPPDINVRAFTGTWMSPGQTNPYTTRWTGGDQSVTVADPPSLPGITETNMWGALWSYAKAVKYASYVAGKAEPQTPLTGYATFATTDFGTLYQSGLSTSSYPSLLAGGTPYKALVTLPPNNKRLAEENRRVLNIPLLACPVALGTNVKADVLAVGKFFMTVPAASDSIVAEFAGIAPEQSLADQVELFQ